MLRRYWIWGAVLATSGLLVAGCESVPGSKSASQRDQHAAALKRERLADQSAERLAKAHAHYSAGIIHEMAGEARAAAEEYYQAALLDPDDEALTLRVACSKISNRTAPLKSSRARRRGPMPRGKFTRGWG